MRRSFGFWTIGMALLTLTAACSSDDDDMPPAPSGSAGAAGSGGAGTAGSAGAAGSATGGVGTGGSGGSAGTGGAPDSSTDGAVDGGAVSPLFSFFITSTGSGASGGNLGGLTGADQKCQTLAAAVGAGSKTWRAYLSVSSAGPDGGAVNARDRIGTGPWYNVKGDLIATNLETLHEETDAGMNGLTAATGLDERGNSVPLGGDAGANQHDILTGSRADGRAFPATPDYTCSDWTSSTAGPPPAVQSDAASDAGDAAALDAAVVDAAIEAGTDATIGDGAAPGPRAYVGHFNRTGTNAPPLNASWNSSHATQGCAQADLTRVGGAGRIYCFAISNQRD